MAAEYATRLQQLMEKLKADKNTAWQQLQQQERELAEIRVQLQQ